MRTILPSANPQNINFIHDICQNVKNFACDMANRQSHRTGFNYKAKWYSARLVLLLAIGFLVAGASQAFGQITQVTGSPQTATTGGTTLSINKPSGLTVNNIMIAQIIQSGNNNVSSIGDATISGWTKITGSNITANYRNYSRATILYRIATASDVSASSFSFSLDGNSDDGEGAIIAFTGVDITTGPFDVTPGSVYTNLASDNTLTATSITTTTANSAVIMFGAVNNDNSLSNWSTTNPGSLTELYDLPFNNSNIDIGLGAAWRLMPTAGSTGTGTATISNGDNNGAILIALRPVPPPTITDFSPSDACPGSGASVVITGTNFTGATAVTFYNNRTASFTVNNATQITATLPSNAATGKISITTPGGTVTSSSDFTVKPLPSVTNSILTQTICSGETTSEVTLNSDIIGTTFAWTGTGTPGVSGFQTNGTNPIDAQTITTSVSTQGTVTFAITPTADGCAGSVTNYVIYVNPTSVGGTASAAASSICSGTSTTITLAGFTGSIQWQQSATGLDGWNNVTSGSGATSSTYTTPNLTEHTYYRAEVTSGTCSSEYSTVAGVTINVPATPDIPSSDSPQCADAGVILTATGSAPSGETWYWQGTNVNGTSTADNASSPLTVFTSGTYYIRSQSNSGLCWGDPANVDVVVNPLPVNKAVAAEETAVCSGNQTNITVASSSATVNYQLRIGTDPIGLAVPGNGGTLSIATGALTARTTFNILATDDVTGCSVQMTTTPTVDVNSAPTADVSGSQTICQNGSALVTGANATNYTSLLWTHDGAGTLTGANTLLPTYSAVAADAGNTVTLTLTASSNGCTPATATYTINVESLPTAVAGGSASVCPGGSVTVTGTSASNGTILWSHDGSGSLSNPTTLNPTYNSVEGDNIHPTITLTMTVTSDNVCAPLTAKAYYTLTVTSTTAVAGDDVNTCSASGPVNITAGSSVTNSPAFIWTSTGTGTLSNETSLTACTYAPSALDISNGSVTITLSAFAFPPCSSATSSKTLTIYSSPTASAGTAVTTCSNAGTVNITAGASAANYASIQWTSSGTGTFVNEDNLSTCTYLPSAADIAAGSVILKLTAKANADCLDAISTKTLTIKAAPTAFAGTNVSTCSNSAPVNITTGATAENYSSLNWISSGTGTFTNRTSLTACTYLPSAADKTAGSVTLTLTAYGNSPCADVISLPKTLTISPAPTAVAGTSLSECYSSGSINITSGASSNASSILWTSSGTGTFADATSLTTCAYTPSAADVFAGGVTLTLTAYGVSPCANAVSTKTLALSAAPTATAGPDIYICSNSGAVNITDGSDATNYTSIAWTTKGDGSFTNPNSLSTCTYTPGSTDISTGVVELTLTVHADAPCTEIASTKNIHITTAPTASAGGSTIICVNGSYTLTGGEASSSGGTILWTHNGTGILSDATTLTPTYTPAAGDAGKPVILTLTVSSSPCTPATAIYTIHVDGLPVATAGGSQTICMGGTAKVSGASSANGLIAWTENGAGSITSGATTLTPTYTPDVADAGTTVTLTMTVTSTNACSSVQPATATYTVTVTSTTANAGNPVTTCALAGPVKITSGSSITNSPIPVWTSSGTGTFTNPNSLTDCYYTPSAADTAAGSVTLILTAFTFPPCINATSTKILTIDPAPVATAGGSQTICENGTATVSGASASHGTILWTKDGGAGFLTDETTLTPTYTAAAGDAGKTIILTMRVTSNNVCAPAYAEATYSVVVEGLPTATAGGSQTICEDGSAIVSDASATNGTILWTENGAGNLTNEKTLYPTYIAAAGDAGNTVTLTMTVTSDNACGTATATATYLVHVEHKPTASAGGSQTICENGSATVSGAAASNGTILWTKDGGEGYLTGETTLTPTYFAAPGDAGTTVPLTMTVSNSPCADATATYLVTVEGLPTASAGGSLNICVNQTGTVFGASSSNGTILWTEDGAGSITAGATSLTPTYTPEAGDAGNKVTLTMSVTSDNACSSATPATAIFTINVNALPTALAGGSQTICLNKTATVTGASASNGTILWTHNGAGTLSNATTESPTYTPGAGDQNNTVTLTMTVSDGPCSEATANYYVTVDPLPFASAGGSTTICSSGSATVSGATAAYGTILWAISNGSGILTDETTTAPTYKAVTADAGKTVTLTMTVTSNNSCGTATATATYTIHVQTAFPLTSGVTICQGGIGSLLSLSSCASGGSTSSGAHNANRGADSTAIGSYTWSNPGNITANDGSDASVTLSNSGTKSHYLKATRYSFNIPTNANISGIQVTIGRSASASRVWETDLFLLKNDVIVGNNKASTSTIWPTAEAPVTYGGTTDLSTYWGTTFAPSDINSSKFGVVLSVNRNSGGSANALVNYMQITVHYTIPGDVNWYTASSGGTLLDSGSPFNPVGVTGSGLATTNTPGTYTFYAECTTQPGCRTATDFVILAAPVKPTLNALGSTSICTTGTGSVTLESSSPTGNQWYRDGNLIGGANNPTLVVTQVGDYTVTVSDGTCTSVASDAISVTSTSPSITLTGNATSVCFDAVNPKTSYLDYSGTTNSPATYSISWDETPPFVAVIDAPLLGSPISITVPANTPIATYHGHITVKTLDGCSSVSQAFTLMVNLSVDATFNYVSTLHNTNGDPQYCQNNPDNPIPTVNPPAVTGTFSALQAGLVFADPLTGEIALGASTPGIYTITNTVSNGGCISTFTQDVEILSLPAITISYSQPGFCNALSTLQSVSRTPIGDISGSYSATPAGLSINGINDGLDINAGKIDPSASQPGIYTVKYIFTNFQCSGVATTTVVIYSEPVFSTQPSTSAQAFCLGGTATPLTVSANPGSGATITNYEWFSNTSASASGATSVGSGASMSGFAPLTASVGTLFYYCVVTDNHGCSSTSNFSGPVTINPPVANNTIHGGGIVCSTETPAYLPGDLPTGGDGNSYTYLWESSADNSNFTPAVGINNEQNYTTGILTTDTWFRRTVISGGCTDPSSSVLMTVIPGPVQYLVEGTTKICWGESAAITLSSSDGNVTYQLRDESGNLIGDPLPGDGYPKSFPVGPLESTTTYNIIASDGQSGCTGLMSGTPTITVVPAITDNTVSPSQTVCPGVAAQRLVGSVPSGGSDNFLYKWQFSTDNFNTYSDAPGVNDGQNYFPGVLTRDTWYRRIVTSDICASLSNIVKMTLNTLPAPVTVSGPAQFCGSTTLTASNGGDGTIFFQGSVSGGTSTILGGSSQVVTTSGTYYFRAFNGSCWGQEGSITVALTSSPSTYGTTICQGGNGALVSATIPPCSSPMQSFTKFPGTGTNNTGTGTIAWTNPGNITTAGSPYAVASTVPINGGKTNYLMATNYGFDIPVDADIYGITVTVNRSSSGNSNPYIRDNTVQLVRANTIVGNNRANTSLDWTPAMGTATYGDPTDTWGITGLTAADINSSGFGVALSAVNTNTVSFPVIKSKSTSVQSTATSTHTVVLPTGISAGDLLIVFFTNSDNGALDNYSVPSGWTTLHLSTDVRRLVIYKTAGTSEGTSITIQTRDYRDRGVSVQSAHNVYCIQAGTFTGNVYYDSPSNTGTSANPNPSSNTPTFGAGNTMWIAASYSDGVSNVTSAPSNYGSLTQAYSGTVGSNGATMATAFRNLNAASEDPGTFTLSSSVGWGANTIAIQGLEGTRNATVDYIQVTVTAQVNGVLNWYTSDIGGTFMGSGSPFDPVGKPGGLTDTSIPGTYSYYSECSAAPGCRTKTDFVIDELPEISSALKKSYNGSDLSCSSASDGEITVTATGTSTLMYSKDNGATYQASNIFIGLGAGTYQIRARNLNLCESAATTVILTAPLPISSSASVTSNYNGSQLSCALAEDGQITVIAGGGTGTLMYSIDGGSAQVSNIFSGLAAGVHSILITDANGCTAIASATIIPPDDVTISSATVTSDYNGSQISCSTSTDGIITVTATGGSGTLEYSSNGGGAYQSSNVFTGLGAGTYQIVVRDANMCSSTATPVTITAPAAVVITDAVKTLYNGADLSCATATDGIITITATGGTGTLEYSSNNGGTYQSSNVFTGLGAGTYQIVVRDANLCTSAATPVTITAPAAVVITDAVKTLYNGADLSCATATDGVITVTATGGTGTLEYSSNNGGAYQSSNVFTGLGAGTYQIVVRDANLCTSSATPVTITAPAAVVITDAVKTLHNGADLSCATATDGVITVTATGGTGTLEYSSNNGGTYQSSNVITGLGAGTYQIVVRDANMCTSTATPVTIIAPEGVTISNATVTSDFNGSQISCSTSTDGIITVTATGGSGTLEYSSNNGGSYQSSNVFTSLGAGTYQIVVRDANMCASAATPVTITAPAAVVIADAVKTLYNGADLSCATATDGVITVTATGGTGTLEYSSNNGGAYQSSNVFTGLGAGTYQIVVRDANLCTSAATPVTITAPAAVLITDAVKTLHNGADLSCATATDGIITVTATGGTGTLEYSDNNGGSYQASNIFGGLGAGTYQIVVRDANLCTSAATPVTITAPAAVVITDAVKTLHNGADLSCSTSTDGIITVTATGGTGTLEYSNNNGGAYQASNIFTGLGAGTYQIVVRDANMCTSAATPVTITAPAAVVITDAVKTLTTELT